MNQVVRRLERMPTVQFALVWASVSLLPLLMIPWVGTALDISAIVVSVIGISGGGWLAQYRRKIRGLPLEFAAPALTGLRGKWRVFRFRVRLGRNRCMRKPRAQISFLSDQGEAIELKPLCAECPVLIGPWTLVTVDPSGLCDQPGSFTVSVRVEEQGRIWEASRTWRRSELGEGRFGGGLRLVGGRLCLDTVDWETVTPESAVTSV